MGVGEVRKIGDEIPMGTYRFSSPSRNPVADASELTGVHKSRTRSRTSNGNPTIPIIGTVEPPSPAAASADYHMSTSSFNLSPPITARRPPPQTDGLPSSPAVTRRATPSLLVPKPGTLAHQPVHSVQASSYAHPSPADGHPSLTRDHGRYHLGHPKTGQFFYSKIESRSSGQNDISYG
jgi:hypothetical protein